MSVKKRGGGGNLPVLFFFKIKFLNKTTEPFLNASLHKPFNTKNSFLKINNEKMYKIICIRSNK